MIIHLLGSSGTYVTAINGGGGAVQADAAIAQNWEALVLCDALGQPFGENPCDHGFQVSLRTEKGQFLLPGWGSGVTATAPTPPVPPMIILRAAGAGRVRDGDAVSFSQLLVGAPLVPVNPFWLTVTATTPRMLAANRQLTSPAATETFTLIAQRFAGITVTPDRALPGATPQVRVPDRPNEPREVRATVGISGPAPRGGTLVDLQPSAPGLTAAFTQGRVLVPEGARSLAVTLRVQRTGPAPSECVPAEQLFADVTVRSTSSIPAAGQSFSARVQLVPANAHANVLALEPLKRGREGVIQVQLKPDAPLAAGEYRVRLSAPADQLLVETGETRVRFEPGLATAPVMFTVVPLVAPSGGVCVSATVTGADGRKVEQRRPFPVAST